MNFGQHVKGKWSLAAFLFIFTCCFSQGTRAAESDDGASFLDTVKQAINTVSQLNSSTSCLVYGSAQIFMGDSVAYSCVKNNLLNVAIKLNKLSGTQYGMTALSTYMDLPSVTGLKGNCSTQIDPHNLALTFGYCNSEKLSATFVQGLISKTVRTVLSSINLSTIPATDIDKNLFIDVYTNSVGTVKNIPLTANSYGIIQNQDRLCIAIPDLPSTPLDNLSGQPTIDPITQCVKLRAGTVSNWTEVGCKYISEPCSTNKYQGFMSDDKEVSANLQSFWGCTAGSTSCYQDTVKHSRAFYHFSAPLVKCVQQAIANVIISPYACSLDNTEQLTGAYDYQPGALYSAQVGMSKVVKVLFILYIIVFGAKLALGKIRLSAGQIAFSIIKFILIAYFSIGLNIDSSSGDRRVNGMIQVGFPLMFTAMNQFANLFMNTLPNETCYFSPSMYEPGYENLALWDSLDCKLGYYLGIDPAVDNKQQHSVYFYLLMPLVAFAAGYFIILPLILVYILVVVLLSAYVVNAFLANLIILACLAVLAPITIPLALFEQTKNYFNQWLRIVIALTLQPMVAVAFLLITFKAIDFGIAKDCIHKTHNIGQASISTIDLDPTSYSTTTAFENCRNSLAGLNQQFQQNLADIQKNEDDKAAQLAKIPGSSLGWFITKASSGVTNSTTSVSTLEFDWPAILSALLKSSLVLYTCYYFSNSLNSFAASLTGGLNLSAITMDPKAVMNAIKEAVKFAIEVGVMLATGGAGGAAGAGGTATRGGLNVQQKLTDSLKEQGKQMVSSSGNGPQLGQSGPNQEGSPPDNSSSPELASEPSTSAKPSEPISSTDFDEASLAINNPKHKK